MWFSQGNCDLNCGTGLIGDFDAFDADREYKTTFGTGIFLSGFIPNKTCKEAYHYLRGRYKLVYQSPVRINSNTGNPYITTLFDSRNGFDTVEFAADWPWE